MTKDATKLEKEDVRRVLRARRATFSLENPLAPVLMRDLFTANLVLPESAIVAFYVSSQDEMNPAPLAEQLRLSGHRLALPCVQKGDKDLVFRLFEPSDTLEQGPLSIPQPASKAPTVEPDLFLVPLVGFDRQKNRLGQGAGYYDRTLARAREERKVTAVGLAFSVQEIDEIPHESHDERLDYIVTEKEFFE